MFDVQLGATLKSAAQHLPRITVKDTIDRYTKAENLRDVILGDLFAGAVVAGM